MIGKKILNERFITISEAYEIMKKRAELGDLSYEQKCALDYLEKFKKLTPEKAKELVEELKKIGVDEETAVKIADILPEDIEDLEVIYYKRKLPENAEEILEVVRKYL
ncbi:RNA polymerase Rpb4 [Methanocaldococcus infernus ME]|uniref:DNA-directed RNA polymerase subunit Rpo4 n=1 Tax=Methanocaldococcus infernus (strain DSM 11812 / JCM 15783 / ME) TaxID=573063 RepID=D5VT31_METIM|nr:RNA polymerase Rpb4 family protein [Methanocaldococcus infernus]ADG13734.1 RNA polymerase Rpb4 [Methanocaldococcus infernus ME]